MFNPGQEQPVSLKDGRSFTLGRLEIRRLRAWRDWIANRIGDPFELADKYLGKMPEADWRKLFDEAKEVQAQLRNFSLTCPLARQYMATEEGMAVLLQQLLLKAHPQATEEDGLAVFLHLGEQAALEALAKAQGEVPGGKNADGAAVATLAAVEGAP